MDIKETRYNTIKKSINFVDLKNNEGDFFFDNNRFYATKPYKMNGKLIIEPDPTVNIHVEHELYEIILDKNIHLDITPDSMLFGDSVIFIIRQDNVGGHTVTFSSNFKFPSGNAPNLTLQANGVDMIGCIIDNNGQLLCDATVNFM